MLIKLLLPKYSTFLRKQGKSCVNLWDYTVRRYTPDSSSSEESEERWHCETHTCGIIQRPHSPINIDLTKLVPRPYPPFSFIGYDDNTRTMLANNGYLVTIDFPDSNIWYTGGGVLDNFKLHHIHFHWGHRSTTGSEHTIDDRQYPMEMHIVHYNMKYPDIQTAKEGAMGLSVLAFMFEKSMKKNESLTPIIDMLKEIKRPYSCVPIDLPNVKSIFPESCDSYFQYNGFRGHQPTMVWTVFKDTIKIAESQLAEFRKPHSTRIDMATGKAKLLGDNSRIPIEIPDLRVFVNIQSDDEEEEDESAEEQGEEKEPKKKGKMSRFFKSMFKKKKK